MKKLSAFYMKMVLILFLCLDIGFFVPPILPTAFTTSYYIRFLHFDWLLFAVLTTNLIVNIIISMVKKSWDKKFYVYYIIGTLLIAALYTIGII